jgi:hypothetical protein
VGHAHARVLLALGRHLMPGCCCRQSRTALQCQAAQLVLTGTAGARPLLQQLQLGVVRRVCERLPLRRRNSDGHGRVGDRGAQRAAGREAVAKVLRRMYVRQDRSENLKVSCIWSGWRRRDVQGCVKARIRWRSSTAAQRNCDICSSDPAARTVHCSHRALQIEIYPFTSIQLTTCLLWCIMQDAGCLCLTILMSAAASFADRLHQCATRRYILEGVRVEPHGSPGTAKQLQFTVCWLL